MPIRIGNKDNCLLDFEEKISQVIILWNGRKTTHLRSKHVFIYGKIFINPTTELLVPFFKKKKLVGRHF